MAEDNDPEKNKDDDVDENLDDVNEGDGDDGIDLDSLVEEATQEYVALDTTLNQLDSYLDVLEQKNDDLYAKVRELLESSHQMRMEMQQANQHGDKGDNPDGDADSTSNSTDSGSVDS